jgi:hypothetical protein
VKVRNENKTPGFLKNQVCFGFAGSSPGDRRRQSLIYIDLSPNPSPRREGLIRLSKLIE